MMYLIGIGLIMLLAVVIVALGYRGEAKAQQRHAELQQQRAEAAEFANTHREQLDTALQTIHNTHREETIHATNPAHLARRSDFDNDWSADAGLHASITNTDSDRAGAASTEPAGITGDQVSRAELSE
jgi:hypothetical protein